MILFYHLFQLILFFLFLFHRIFSICNTRKCTEITIFQCTIPVFPCQNILAEKWGFFWKKMEMRSFRISVFYLFSFSDLVFFCYFYRFTLERFFSCRFVYKEIKSFLYTYFSFINHVVFISEYFLRICQLSVPRRCLLSCVLYISHIFSSGSYVWFCTLIWSCLTSSFDFILLIWSHFFFFDPVICTLFS